MAKINTVQVCNPKAEEPGVEANSFPTYIGQLPEPMQAQALHLLAQLHTNLDIERLLQAFSLEIRKAIPHGAIGVDCPDCRVPIADDAGPLQQHIHLIVDEDYLCDLRLYGPRRLTTAELWQLELWLRVLAYPLRNAIQLHRMHTQVFRDALTGVQNRIAMDQAMSREVSSALRHQHELSMLVIDIDWFKSINDRFGHSTGDVALRLTADLIRSSLRDSDQIFRYGGEEFIVLLSHTDTLGAVILAERIRRNIALRDHLVGDIRIPITVSVGVAMLEMGDNVDSFFEKADHALYRAKDGGRNKVCCHQAYQAKTATLQHTPNILMSKAL
jgi:diguanylate cyclase (GGDEF)-like protein